MRFKYVLAIFLLFIAQRASAITFAVTLDPSLPTATGRLVVFLDDPKSSDFPADDSDPFHPQPRYGIDVHNLAPAGRAVLDDHATASPVTLSHLPAGKYRAAAVLIVHREHSNWRSDPGNLYSDVITFDPQSPVPQVIPITLNHIVAPRKWETIKGIDLVEVRSKLLSDFLHRDIILRAGVIHPSNEDPSRAYPAVYDVPGFGGDHFYALHAPHSHAVFEDRPAGRALWANAFHIVLDPESPNGHTLFLNSDNNGPRGDALVQELIPELERRYHLIPAPNARLLRGHSSGGLTTLLLALHYPQTFGATWSISPDPVDFHHFERADIYTADSMYQNTAGPIPSARFNGQPTLTVQLENQLEEVLGPGNTSAQSWDAWQAAFGHRLANGHVAAMFDPLTGKIDHTEAAYYRRCDITQMLADNPATYAPLFRERIHLIVGDQDNFYLNEAVTSLASHLDHSNAGGYIKIVPGADHISIYNTPEMAVVPTEMMHWLQSHGTISGAR
jgi:hypothetical protein